MAVCVCVCFLAVRNPAQLSGHTAELYTAGAAIVDTSASCARPGYKGKRAREERNSSTAAPDFSYKNASRDIVERPGVCSSAALLLAIFYGKYCPGVFALF